MKTVGLGRGGSQGTEVPPNGRWQMADGKKRKLAALSRGAATGLGLAEESFPPTWIGEGAALHAVAYEVVEGSESDPLARRLPPLLRVVADGKRNHVWRRSYETPLQGLQGRTD